MPNNTEESLIDSLIHWIELNSSLSIWSIWILLALVVIIFLLMIYLMIMAIRTSWEKSKYSTSKTPTTTYAKKKTKTLSIPEPEIYPDIPEPVIYPDEPEPVIYPDEPEPEIYPDIPEPEIYPDIPEPVIYPDELEPVSLNQILRIGYDPVNPFPQSDPWAYPVIKMPKKGSVIREPRLIKQQLRGYKEEEFEITLTSYFSPDYEINGNHRIATSSNTRPYEPDISIIRKSQGLNLFIDIEIDEPYAGISRKPLHLEGDDNHRDDFFTDRGWIVLRFAEKQVHLQEQKCIAMIAKVIEAIDLSFSIPSALSNIPLPFFQPSNLYQILERNNQLTL